MTCFYVKRNGIVYLTITLIEGHTDDLKAIKSKIPVGYRPISGFGLYFPIGNKSNSGDSGMCNIHSDGTIATIAPHDSMYFAGVVAYPAE